MSRHFLIAVGASAGGVTAIRGILQDLDPQMTWPIAIVQHLPAITRLDVSMIYGQSYGRDIIEVEDKMAIQDGSIYMATPDYHLLVEKNETFSLSQDEPVYWSRPSIDVFFESIAKSYGSRAIGILLTGANEDGAQGLKAIGLAGGITIAQDPRAAEAPTMPRAAISLRQPDFIFDLQEIAGFLNRSAQQSLESKEKPV